MAFQRYPLSQFPGNYWEAGSLDYLYVGALRRLCSCMPVGINIGN